jgi:hypothetical protein
MIAEDLVARLEKVRKAGDRSWSARCPAHADKGPSLRVTDKDGMILIHCFAGCGAADVAAALGLSLSDLFPPRDPHERAVYAREKFTKGTLKELKSELTIAMIILGDMVSGKPLKPADLERGQRARKTILKIVDQLAGVA